MEGGKDMSLPIYFTLFNSSRVCSSFVPVSIYDDVEFSFVEWEFRFSSLAWRFLLVYARNRLGRLRFSSFGSLYDYSLPNDGALDYWHRSISEK